jgi:hypothetical protein
MTTFAALQLIQQMKVKKTGSAESNHRVRADVSWPDAGWRCRMRALSYIIALVFVLTGPSLAGKADGDLPGVGTFAYCGSPVVMPVPEMVVALGQ